MSVKRLVIASHNKGKIQETEMRVKHVKSFDMDIKGE